MKNTKGFTLIELLVVVLIIGILAAIALPIYFNVTKASKIKANISVLRPLIEAEHRNKLATGQYQHDIDLLDVQIPYITKTISVNKGDYTTDWGTIRIISSGANMDSTLRIGLMNMPGFNGSVTMFDPNDKESFEAQYPGGTQYSVLCAANDSSAEGVCKAIGTYFYTNGSTKYYGF